MTKEDILEVMHDILNWVNLAKEQRRQREQGKKDIPIPDVSYIVHSERTISKLRKILSETLEKEVAWGDPPHVITLEALFAEECRKKLLITPSQEKEIIKYLQDKK